MRQTFRKVVTVEKGGLIQVRSPQFPIGARAEVSIQVGEDPPALDTALAVPKVSALHPSLSVPTPSPAVKGNRAFAVDPAEYLIPEVAPTVEPPTAEIMDLDDEETLTQSRQRLLASLAESDFGKMEHRVAYILQTYLDTRDDDIALLIRYYEEFQTAVLEQWKEPTLDILYDLENAETILRMRRHIQNGLGLFVGTLRTRMRRSEIARQFYAYMIEKRADDAEIRFYLDETKGDPGSRYLGVAGVCVIDWRQYEKYYAAISQWRLQQGWPETLHVATQGQHDISKHLSLLAQVQRRRGGLLFVGHDMATRAVSHHTLIDLFVQLTMGCLRMLQADGCLGERRAVRVIKEAEEGFDRVHLETLNRELQQQIAFEFPNTAYMAELAPVQKGREVFLEVADMIAAGMQRRALYGGWQSKDKLAEAVANVTGFEDSAAKGVVYKAWYHSK